MSRNLRATLTLLLAVDNFHLRELALVWPTWARYHPEVLQLSTVVILDHQGGPRLQALTREFLSAQGKPLHDVTWLDTSSLAHLDDQRERMLSSFVLLGPAAITTPWYLKLDTDAVARAWHQERANQWLAPAWFAPARDSAKHFAFVASPWGFTKPATAIAKLDAWGDSTPMLSGYPRLNLVPTPGADRLRHRRIISWCFVGNTSWSRLMAEACLDNHRPRLPVPSQDTFLWYCARRRGDMFHTIKMKDLGWNHVPLSRRSLPLEMPVET